MRYEGTSIISIYDCPKRFAFLGAILQLILRAEIQVSALKMDFRFRYNASEVSAKGSITIHYMVHH